MSRMSKDCGHRSFRTPRRPLAPRRVVRDRTRTGKYLLGSDAQDVLLGAKCRVLSVKVEDE